MFTPAYPKDEVAWVIKQNLKLPREYAARLLYDHATRDWRRIIPRINIPTLVVGGKTSLVPWKSQVWIANHIRAARLEILEESAGGHHFLVAEKPQQVNRIVRELMG